MKLMGRIKNKYDQMFFKWGVNIFYSTNKEYGGYNHFLAGTIFRWKIAYLTIYFNKWEWGWEDEDPEWWNDGYHNAIYIGWITISYGT